RRRRRRLPAQAVRARGTARPPACAAAPLGPPGRRVGVGRTAHGRPHAGPRDARGHPRLTPDPAHSHRVRVARTAVAQPPPGADPRSDPRGGVGLRLPDHRQLPGGLRRLPAAQDRGSRRAPPDPHRARRRLRGPRGSAVSDTTNHRGHDVSPQTGHPPAETSQVHPADPDAPSSGDPMPAAAGAPKYATRLSLRARVGALAALGVGLAVTLTALAAYLTVSSQLTASVDDNLL